MSREVQKALGSGLPSDVRVAFDRLCDAYFRDVIYMVERKNPALQRARANGWTADQISALLVLAAFQRLVMGPVGAAFDTPTKAGFGREVPIAYGTFRIDGSAKALRRATEAFESCLERLEIKRQWLGFASAQDLVFALGRGNVQE